MAAQVNTMIDNIKNTFPLDSRLVVEYSFDTSSIDVVDDYAGLEPFTTSYSKFFGNGLRDCYRIGFNLLNITVLIDIGTPFHGNFYFNFDNFLTQTKHPVTSYKKLENKNTFKELLLVTGKLVTKHLLAPKPVTSNSETQRCNVMAQVQVQTQKSIPVKEFFISIPKQSEEKAREEERLAPLVFRDGRGNAIVVWEEHGVITLLLSDGRRVAETVLDESDLARLAGWFVRVLVNVWSEKLQRVSERLARERRDLEGLERGFEESRVVWGPSEVEQEIRRYAVTLQHLMHFEERYRVLEEAIEAANEFLETIEKVI